MKKVKTKLFLRVNLDLRSKKVYKNRYATNINS